MPFKLRTVDDLAEELGSVAEANKKLKEAGAAVVHGLFDQGALDALAKEPGVTNIGKKAKNLFTIAPTDGIGAVKAVLDELEVDVVRHIHHRANYITVRNAKDQRVQLKMYSAATKHERTGNAAFTLSGYLRDTASNFYLLMCFSGPVAWAIPRATVIALHKATVKAGGEGDFTSIAKNELDNLNGRMRIRLNVESEYILKSAKQIGL